MSFFFYRQHKFSTQAFSFKCVLPTEKEWLGEHFSVSFHHNLTNINPAFQFCLDLNQIYNETIEVILWCVTDLAKTYLTLRARACRIGQKMASLIHDLIIV